MVALSPETKQDTQQRFPVNFYVQIKLKTAIEDVIQKGSIENRETVIEYVEKLAQN